MTGINEVINVSPEQNRVNRQSDVNKIRAETKQRKTQTAHTADAQKDQAQISQAAKKLLSLRNEAKKYVDQVKSTETLPEKKLDEMKQKIQDKNYLTPQVINSIVDKLMDLPNFFNK